MNLPSFKNKQLLEQAFTHRSYLNEVKKRVESNERLEFLGDSILSFLVSSHIYKLYPSFQEGELTNLRSLLINTHMLYEVAKELDLGTHLLLSKGEEASGGRENKTLLANTFEALTGALFLDQGLDRTKRFIEEVLFTRIHKIQEQGLKDPKSLLQEIIQERNKIAPSYKIINEEGPDHAKLYTIGVYIKEKLLSLGVGSSKQEAEKNAAKKALDTL